MLYDHCCSSWRYFSCREAKWWLFVTGLIDDQLERPRIQMNRAWGSSITSWRALKASRRAHQSMLIKVPTTTRRAKVAHSDMLTKAPSGRIIAGNKAATEKIELDWNGNEATTSMRKSTGRLFNRQLTESLMSALYSIKNNKTCSPWQTHQGKETKTCLESPHRRAHQG